MSLPPSCSNSRHFKYLLFKFKFGIKNDMRKKRNTVKAIFYPNFLSIFCYYILSTQLTEETLSPSIVKKKIKHENIY